MDRAAFDLCVETRLAPALSPGTVFVGDLIYWTECISSPLDNLSPHRSPEADELPIVHGGWRRSWGQPCTGRLSDPSNLPACPTDPNPIEMAFSKLEAHLCRIGARTYDTLIRALRKTCGLFDPDEC